MPIGYNRGEGRQTGQGPVDNGSSKVGLITLARNYVEAGRLPGRSSAPERAWITLPSGTGGYRRGCTDAESGGPPARRRDPDYMAGYADALLERVRTVLDASVKA